MAARVAGFVTLEGDASAPWAPDYGRPVRFHSSFLGRWSMVRRSGMLDWRPALAVHSGPPMPVPDPIETVAPSAITRVTFPSDFASSPSDSFIRV